jgi:hypothetical protein
MPSGRRAPIRAVAEEDRDWLVRAHHTASQDFDRAVIALAGGGLGISLAFVKDIAPNPIHIWLLAVAWLALASSLVLIFVSLLTSQGAILRQISDIDAGRKYGERFDLPGWLTTGVNIGSATTFVLGVVFLVIFALYNV